MVSVVSLDQYTQVFFFYVFPSKAIEILGKYECL